MWRKQIRNRISTEFIHEEIKVFTQDILKTAPINKHRLWRKSSPQPMFIPEPLKKIFTIGDSTHSR
ncbi:hypothetical protein EMIT079MI2_40265 [Bacillus sp. IT-79MI2]